MENRYKEIVDKYGKEYALRQLAEECNELGQAALKLIRVWNKETPMREDEAYDHLVEEIADVNITIAMVYNELLDRQQCNAVWEIRDQKKARMYERLLDGKMEEDVF